MSRSTALLLFLLALVAGPGTADHIPVVTLLPPQFDQIAALPEPGSIPARLGQTRPTVASSGSGWLLAWSDSRYGDEDVFATLIDAQGRAATPEGRAVGVTAESDRSPAALWTGKDYLVAWSTRSGVFGAHLNTSGSIVSSGVLVPLDPPRPARDTAIARNGDRILLLWVETTVSDVIRWTLLDANGIAVTGTSDFAAASFGAQRNPAAAPVGDGFAVTWEEMSESGTTVLMRTLSRSGSGGSVHTIGSGPARTAAAPGMWTQQATPAVAPAPEGALVVWTDGALLARRVGGSGPAAETITLTREAIALTPAVVATAGGWEILWSGGPPAAPSPDGVFDLSSYDLFATTLPSTGTPSTRKAVAAPQAQTDPAIASAGSEIFAAWTDFRLGKSTDRVETARFSSDLFGALLRDMNGSESAGSVLTSSVAGERPLAIAALGTLSMRAVWEEELDDDELALVTQAFAPGGTPLDPRRVIARGVLRGADIAASGLEYAIAWAAPAGVFVQRIDRDGVLEGPAAQLASDGASPRIASDGRDFVIVWDAPAPDSTGAGRRVLARGMTEEGLVSPSAEIVASEAAETPVIAWTGSNYLVAWADTGTPFAKGAKGRFISREGTPLGAAALTLLQPIKYGQGPQSVASRGSEHIVSVGSQLLWLDASGAVVRLQDAGGAIALVWAGATFAGARLDAEGAVAPWPRLADIALFGAHELVGIAAAPLAQAGAVTRAVLVKARFDPARRRLTTRH